MKTTIKGAGAILPAPLHKWIYNISRREKEDDTCWVFHNGNYWILFLEDGTKFRFNLEDSLVPDHPECIDMTISTYCENNCPFCYMGCSINGKQVDLKSDDLNWVLSQLWPGTELAVNCNSLNQITFNQFKQFLVKVHNDCPEVFVNTTIHQRDFMVYSDQLASLQEEGLIHGIGVSIQGSKTYSEFTSLQRKLNKHEEMNLKALAEKINSCKNVVLHIIPRLVELDTFTTLQRYLNKHNILVLGYKNMGRGVCESTTDREEINLSNWEMIARGTYERTVNFQGIIAMDNLALKELHAKNWMDEDYFNRMYAGNEGAYTFYLDLPNRKYARSSIDHEQFDWGDKTLLQMFQSIQTPALGEEGGIMV